MGGDFETSIGSAVELSPDQSLEMIRVLENYLGELERGEEPDRDALLASLPELAPLLKPYLAKLE